MTRSPLRLTAALLRHLIVQPKATVMTVSSGLAFVPIAPFASYCATKAAPTAGAINIVTARPTDEWGGYVRGSIGNYNSVKAEGASADRSSMTRCLSGLLDLWIVTMGMAGT